MEVEGGAAGLLGVAVGAYIGLLKEIKENPGDYTWTMDWYYR